MFTTDKEFAKKQDKKDELRKYRKAFYFPRFKDRKAIYFCGNSLGLQPKSVQYAVAQELEDWKELAVGGYLNARNPWLYYQHQFSRPLSLIMGCREHEVTAMNALTVNLHLLLLSFYKPKDGRYKIVMEAGAFPSDQYAAETQVRFYGFDPNDAIIEVAPVEGEKTLRTENIVQAIQQHGDSVALVLFGGINYYTGQLFDIRSITAAAHGVGAIAGFDLAHVAGNVPMDLHDWDVDFAAWCSYKYLNAGPGAVAGIYIHERFANDLTHRRLAGWWGNAEETRFKMEKGFVPQPGAGGWQLSTAQVFNMVALKASLALISDAGHINLRHKSIRLTAYLEFLLRQLQNLDFEIITPLDPEQRGAQLSLFFRQRGKEIHQHLLESGVVVDYREPGVIRVAPSPIYNSFKDVFRLYEILKEL